jgi:hypothetical protein
MIQDLRYAFRQLRKRPGFAVVAVVTLALGIGANGAIFSVVDAFLVRAMPYPHADRQVVVNDVQPSYGQAPASYLEWQDLKDDGRMFEAVSAAYALNVNYAGGELPERLRMLLVDGPYFTMAGLGLAIGLPAALVLVRALRAQLYEIAPSNPLAYGAGIAVLTIVALGACYLPARRAARVAPMEALRYE